MRKMRVVHIYSRHLVQHISFSKKNYIHHIFSFPYLGIDRFPSKAPKLMPTRNNRIMPH